MNNLIKILVICFLPLAGFAQTIGYDLDKNRCNKAAGMTFSKIKNECVQPFNQPIMVQSLDDGTKSYSTQTPLIFNEDKSKVEVFLPDSNKSLILKRSKKDPTTWKKSGVQVKEDGNSYQVHQKGKLIYQSA
ncbi:hypothetical protein [Moheibacter stercoris]|uniref:Membrane-bound lysozyme-inhibitor of c-type lysozyme n=1 Tax=Moheibacter stercoris TaxID=1628251 RepID=A0ABV2LTQ2_9FLAO